MNNNIVDEIKSRCNIVDVIGHYMTLKKKGANHWGLCPFHNEKTPSFSVSESKQFYNCFGCGESGDVINFVMKYENIDFHGAITKLSEMYGIEMDSFGFKNEGKKNEIYELNREAARFFFKNLTSQQNPGLEYMKGRGLDSKTLTKFGIGYARDSWSDLTDYLRSKGYKEELMYDAGLVLKSQKTGKYYDKFRNRVIFPILNTRGKVIGFGGRDLGDDGPKYLNSPESAVFSKKNNLYGLNLTRQDINASNQAIIVEGYMDLVSLYKNGITNVAATLGTALTENQCQLLKRYTENVILSYDADAAGRKAALRGIELLHDAGLKARVLHVTDGKDPDEFVKKHGREAFIKLTEEALPYADYKIDHIRQQHDITTTEGSIDFLKAVKEVLLKLSPVESDVYIKKLSKETGISEGAIRRELNQSQEGGAGVRNVSRAQTAKGEESRQGSDTAKAASTGGNVTLQRQLIRLLSVNAEYIETICEYEYVFVEGVYFNIYTTIKSIYAQDKSLDIRKVADALSPEDASVLQDIIDTVTFPQNSDQVLADCIEKIKYESLSKRQREILDILDLLQEGDEEKIAALSGELMHIQSELQSMRR